MARQMAHDAIVIKCAERYVTEAHASITYENGVLCVCHLAVETRDNGTIGVAHWFNLLAWHTR